MDKEIKEKNIHSILSIIDVVIDVTNMDEEFNNVTMKFSYNSDINYVLYYESKTFIDSRGYGIYLIVKHFNINPNEVIQPSVYIDTILYSCTYPFLQLSELKPIIHKNRLEVKMRSVNISFFMSKPCDYVDYDNVIDFLLSKKSSIHHCEITILSHNYDYMKKIEYFVGLGLANIYIVTRVCYLHKVMIDFTIFDTATYVLLIDVGIVCPKVINGPRVMSIYGDADISDLHNVTSLEQLTYRITDAILITSLKIKNKLKSLSVFGPMSGHVDLYPIETLDHLEIKNNGSIRDLPNLTILKIGLANSFSVLNCVNISRLEYHNSDDNITPCLTKDLHRLRYYYGSITQENIHIIDNLKALVLYNYDVDVIHSLLKTSISIISFDVSIVDEVNDRLSEFKEELIECASRGNLRYININLPEEVKDMFPMLCCSSCPLNKLNKSKSLVNILYEDEFRIFEDMFLSEFLTM